MEWERQEKPNENGKINQQQIKDCPLKEWRKEVHDEAVVTTKTSGG